MSEEKIQRLHDRLDDHGDKLNNHETKLAVFDERHKRADKRLTNLEVNWSWVAKTAAALIITGIVTAVVSGGLVK